jgi:hypothetical protein
MGRRNHGVLCGLVAALALGPGSAAAQSISSPYRFLDTRQAATVFGGYVATGRGALELGPRPGPILGVRYDLGISGPFVLEAELGWFARDRAVQDTVPGDTTRTSPGDADFRAITVQAGLRFNITGARTWHGLLPYALFAGGFTKDVADESGTDAALPADVRFDFGTRFTAGLGGGLEWFPAQGAGIRLDGRMLLWKLKTPAPFLRGDQVNVLPSEQWTQNLSLTAGIVVRF